MRNSNHLCFIRSVILAFPHNSPLVRMENVTVAVMLKCYFIIVAAKSTGSVTLLHKLRFLHCLSHFIETKNGKTILWMPQRFSLCITQHTAYINCAFVLCVQRLLFLCKDLIGLIVEFYRLGEHARGFFLFFFPTNTFLRHFLNLC